MSLPLAGQVALVTGASRGIGRAISLRLAADGAHVVTNYVHHRAGAEATVAEIEEKGGRAEVAGFDVSDAAAVQAAVAGILERHGQCDILVNNAGVTADGLLLRLRDEAWEQVLRINLTGTFHCTRAVLRGMVRARQGRIINLSSAAARLGNAGQSAYSAAKAGIEGFTRATAREVATRNITVNAIAPGFIETEMVTTLPEATREEYLRLIPCRRWGSAEEVASAVAFLSHPSSAYITGQVLGIDGGLHM